MDSVTIIVSALMSVFIHLPFPFLTFWLYRRLTLTTIYFLNSFVAEQYCTREFFFFSYLTTLVSFILLLICTNGNVAVVVVDGKI